MDNTSKGFLIFVAVVLIIGFFIYKHLVKRDCEAGFYYFNGTYSPPKKCSYWTGKPIK